MISKTGFVLLTFSIALFASASIERFSSCGFGNVAWAQDASDADQADGISSGPEVAPPDLNGTSWAGPLVDITYPELTLTIDIFQKQRKLRGDYSTSTGKSGAFTGKFNSDGVSLTIIIKGHHGCLLTMPGALVSATEIKGTYTSKRCKNATSGTYDLTEQ